MQREENMSIRVFYTLTEPLRMVRIPAGHDPATNPLLAHAGIADRLNDPDRYQLQEVPGKEAIETFCDEIDAVLSFEKTCGEIRFPDLRCQTH